MSSIFQSLCFFFFNDTATTEIYTLSLHDALPIGRSPCNWTCTIMPSCRKVERSDRKSTRLNSSHRTISYAVFCLKKKKTRAAYVHKSEANTREKTDIDTMASGAAGMIVLLSEQCISK